MGAKVKMTDDVQKQKRDSEIEPGLTLLGRGDRSGAEVLVVACLVACLKKGDWEEEVHACQSDKVWNSQALNTIQKSVSLLWSVELPSKYLGGKGPVRCMRGNGGRRGWRGGAMRIRLSLLWWPFRSGYGLILLIPLQGTSSLSIHYGQFCFWIHSTGNTVWKHHTFYSTKQMFVYVSICFAFSQKWSVLEKQIRWLTSWTW